MIFFSNNYFKDVILYNFNKIAIKLFNLCTTSCKFGKHFFFNLTLETVWFESQGFIFKDAFLLNIYILTTHLWHIKIYRHEKRWAVINISSTDKSLLNYPSNVNLRLPNASWRHVHFSSLPFFSAKPAFGRFVIYNGIQFIIYKWNSVAYTKQLKN